MGVAMVELCAPYQEINAEASLNALSLNFGASEGHDAEGATQNSSNYRKDKEQQGL